MARQDQRWIDSWWLQLVHNQNFRLCLLCAKPAAWWRGRGQLALCRSTWRIRQDRVQRHLSAVRSPSTGLAPVVGPSRRYERSSRNVKHKRSTETGQKEETQILIFILQLKINYQNQPDVSRNFKNACKPHTIRITTRSQNAHRPHSKDLRCYTTSRPDPVLYNTLRSSRRRSRDSATPSPNLLPALPHNSSLT